jgi:phenylpyruvate tautomerase PptA (4-oxalocrotonate tautomerase family)
MPVTKIHVSSELAPEACRALAEDARRAVVDALGVNPEFGKVIVYTAPPHCRSAHPNRDPGFVLVEVLMFKGRNDDVKRDLFQRLAQAVAQHTNLDEQNIFINLLESDRSAWGIRGGRPAGEVDLGY